MNPRRSTFNHVLFDQFDGGWAPLPIRYNHTQSINQDTITIQPHADAAMMERFVVFWGSHWKKHCIKRVLEYFQTILRWPIFSSRLRTVLSFRICSWHICIRSPIVTLIKNHKLLDHCKSQHSSDLHVFSGVRNFYERSSCSLSVTYGL